ncbi:hypothetical protein KSP39_PZI012350 [Platanthera zijinensis]|uniref:Uncharacterized protein n=1 Tax=Platanthera zijinensis TaxID=2320716 RepID=A0AAP0BG26_9ASPA
MSVIQRRNIEIQNMPDYEQWSPISRNIILYTWENFGKHDINISKYYNSVEWEKQEKYGLLPLFASWKSASSKPLVLIQSGFLYPSFATASTLRLYILLLVI